MANIRYVEDLGAMLVVHFDDNTIQRCLSLSTNRWMGRRTGSATPPPSDDAGEGTGVAITAGMIQAAVQSVGGSTSAMVGTAQGIADSFNAAVNKVAPGILSSKKRAAVLVGECAQETDWYKTTTEYGAGGASYAPYVGRGFIQLTWQSNYAGFGKWMKAKGLLTDENYFVNNPERLADLQWAPYTAIYYFSRTFEGETLWEWCDATSSPWSAVSRAINRGSPSATSPAYGESVRATAINAALAVAPEPTQPTSGDGEALVKWMLDHVGKYAYSQASGRLTPDAYGYTDCSGLVRYCYLQVCKKEIGTYTGAQQNYGRIIIDTNQALNESIMRKGDLVFFNWSYNNPKFDHVEMYLGNNQICGHGGPGNGPTVKSLSGNVSSAYNFRVRRYV